MRKKQEIKVIVHYPKTTLGWYRWMMRIVYADPNMVYDYIKKQKLPPKEREELLNLARSQAELFHCSELDMYRRRPLKEADSDGE